VLASAKAGTGAETRRTVATGSASTFCIDPIPSISSERVVVGFPGADAERASHLRHENLAVADLAGLGAIRDRIDHLILAVVGNHDFDFHFRQEVHRVFGAAIEFGVPLLAAVAFDFGDREALHAERGQRVADILKLEGFDDGDYEFHAHPRAALRVRTADAQSLSGIAAYAKGFCRACGQVGTARIWRGYSGFGGRDPPGRRSRPGCRRAKRSARAKGRGRRMR